MSYDTDYGQGMTGKGRATKIVEVYREPEHYSNGYQCVIPGAWIAVYDTGYEVAICRDYEAGSAAEARAIAEAA